MKKIFLFTLLFSTAIGSSMAQKSAVADPVLEAMIAETDRAKNELKLEEQPPIKFISTYMLETQNARCKAVNGRLTDPLTDDEPMRSAAISVVVGDENITSPLYGFQMVTTMPTGNDKDALRIELWKLMDRVYKGTLPLYWARANRSKSYSDGLTADERELKDFIPAAPAVFTHSDSNIKEMNKKQAEQYVLKISEKLGAHDSIYNSSATLTRIVQTKWVCSSEGSRVKTTTVSYDLSMRLKMHTKKDSPASSVFQKTYASFAELPSTAEIELEIDRMTTDAASLYNTKSIDAIELACILVENSSIPDLISQAKIIGDNIVDRSFIAQAQHSNPIDVIKPALANLKGRRVMSDDITLKSLAGVTTYNDRALLKASKVDLTGMKVPDSITIVEKGVLRNMLVGRKPTTEYSTPTGHILSQSLYQLYPGLTWGVMKMEINPQKLTSRDELYKKMIETTKQRGGQYAYVVGDYGVVKRIDVNDGSVEILNRTQTWVSPPVLKSSGAIIGATNDMILIESVGFTPNLIAPSAILFDEVDLKPNTQSGTFINTSQRPITPRPTK